MNKRAEDLLQHILTAKNIGKSDDYCIRAIEDEFENQTAGLRGMLEPAKKVFDWYLIFGEDNQRAKELLADLGNKLKALEAENGGKK